MKGKLILMLGSRIKKHTRGFFSVVRNKSRAALRFFLFCLQPFTVAIECRGATNCDSLGFQP